MKKIELMAPAGNKDAFLGAINAGANAVYLAGHRFGARAFAENFPTDEMRDLVQYAHLRGASVYVTVNVLIFDDEIESLLAYVDSLAESDVDALIVQDLGMIARLHERYPNIPIHASTQINTHNVQQVQFLKDLGVSRVILGRETPIEVIQAIKKAVDIEVEVFVHGSLCVSYSGHCLFSSLVGHRSGNRGECGQPCRLPYTLLKDGEAVSEEAYLMSTKDLMTLPRIGELVDSGVDALKIEGRMRKPEYVIQSVLSYRQALAAKEAGTVFETEIEIEKLKKVFNREYTDGYLFHAEPHTINNAFRPNHMGVEVGKVLAFHRGEVVVQLSGELSVNDGIRIIGETDTGDVVSRILKMGKSVKTAGAGDVVSIDSGDPVAAGSRVLKTLDHILVKNLEEYLDPNRKMIEIHGKAEIFVLRQMGLSIGTNSEPNVHILSDFEVPAAENAPATKDIIENQLLKLGNTPFFWGSLAVKTDEKGFVPLKVLNELRRQAVNQLTEKLIAPRKPLVIHKEHLIDSIPLPPDKFELIAKIRTLDQLEGCLAGGIKTIYFENSLKVDQTLYPGIEFAESMRRIWPNPGNFPIDAVKVINEVGSLIHPTNYHLIGDTFLNVTNIETAHLLFQNGLKSLTLSPELNQEHLRLFSRLYVDKFGVRPNLEFVVYGRTELMLSKFCPISKTLGVNQTHCGLCQVHQYALKDRMDFEFPLLDDGDCNIRLLNSKPLCLIDSVQFFREAGFSRLRLDFTIENRQETADIVTAFQKALRKESYLVNRHQMTYGRFLK